MQTIALVVTTEEEALTHGRVFYGLVKPSKEKGCGVESTAALVNVVPKKRIYRMDRENELDLFIAEMMRRPMVLQPTAFIMKGIAAIKCGINSRKENWLLMINQNHPKIISKVQAGVVELKQAMARGQPCVLQISFNALLKSIYMEHLSLHHLNPTWNFVDFDDGDLLVRYPGRGINRGLKGQMKAPHIKFELDDIQMSEIIRRTVAKANTECQSPALRVIPASELMEIMPRWHFDDRATVPVPESEDEEEVEELEGATGIDPAFRAYSSDEMLDVILENSAEETSFDDVSHQTTPGKIVGRRRQAAAMAHTKYEVPVELHVPSPKYEPSRSPHNSVDLEHPRSPQSRGDSPPNYEPLHNPVQSEMPYDKLNHIPYSDRYNNGPVPSPRRRTEPERPYESYSPSYRPPSESRLKNDIHQQQQQPQPASRNRNNPRPIQDRSEYSNQNYMDQRNTPGQHYSEKTGVFGESKGNGYGVSGGLSRGYHVHQGSGRSVSSDASDSGFGDDNILSPSRQDRYMKDPKMANSDNGGFEDRQKSGLTKLNKPAYDSQKIHGGLPTRQLYAISSGPNRPPYGSNADEDEEDEDGGFGRRRVVQHSEEKIPYVNPAYQHDHDHLQELSVTSIIEQHKAMAAKMQQRQTSHSVKTTSPSYLSYAHSQQYEVDGEEDRGHNFSNSRLRIESKPVNESFI
ncbi:hypothetical protein CHS0354_003216 [Potamilus streckersoni]|uniref:Uncharacterized protein n=1 Tax=Potamilus streckersoni TaxID=2493646 RepID=A0AAE0SIT4_9BIVA|nr:hypothetical protein CHS0354_003216 [Potamilus streckersoni]